MVNAAPTLERATEAPARPSGFSRIFGSLANNPYYRTYWFGNQANMLMMSMQLVANGYLAYLLTNSAGALGLVSLAGSLPMMLFSPFGGVMSDRFSKRNLLIIVQGVQCLASLVIGTLVVFNVIEYWHLLAASVVQSIGFAIMIPARQGWIPQLVSREDMPNAIAINNAGMNAGRIIGPTLAGILIAVPGFGVNGVYYLRVLAFVAVLYSLLKIPILGNPTARSERLGMWDELTVGYRVIWKSETLRTLFAFALVVTVLGMCYQSLIPAFALGVFDVGSIGQGAMQTAVGLGALTGSLTMAYISNSPHKARIQAYTGALLGIGFIIFGICAGLKSFEPSLVALFIIGFSLDFNQTINNTLIMLNTEMSLYGRIMAAYMVTVSLSPVTASGFGWAMDQIGGGPVMFAVGVTITIFVILMAAFHPGYKKIRNFQT
jgi:MFS family permease